MNSFVPVMNQSVSALGRILDHNRLLIKDMERMLTKVLTYDLSEEDRLRIGSILSYSDEIRKEHNDLIRQVVNNISGLAEEK